MEVDRRPLSILEREVTLCPPSFNGELWGLRVIGMLTEEEEGRKGIAGVTLATSRKASFKRKVIYKKISNQKPFNM